MIGGKTNTTSYPTSIHLESFLANPTKNYWPQNESKRRTFCEMKFSGLNTKLLIKLTRRCSKYHTGCTHGVSSRWKLQVTTGMIRFGSLLTSSFFVFPFRGCGPRENYFLQKRGLFSHQLIRTTTLCCGWGGKCFKLNWHNQKVVYW
jgi:hypothetical protein